MGWPYKSEPLTNVIPDFNAHQSLRTPSPDHASLMIRENWGPENNFLPKVVYPDKIRGGS